MTRSNLSTRAHTLRLSLLASLGVIPIACGGSVVTAGSTGETAGGSAGLGGNVSYGGDVVSYGGTSAVGGSAPATGGASTRPIPACEAPMIDPVTHLVTCGNGFSHRPIAATCSLPNGNGGAVGDTSEAGGPPTTLPTSEECTVDSDCLSLRLGYCYRPGGVAPSCQSGCVQDSDCGASQLCLCDGSAHGGVCAPAACKIDADCGPNSLCASANLLCGGTGFGCLSSQDECNSSADCGPDSECELEEEPYRTCFNGACGRPFLVADTPRLAAVTHSSAWLDETLFAPDLRELSQRDRARLAEHWTRLAQMEHASIAAFARFNLQLLSLGAPAQLIEACTRAIADETAHARLCFSMASQYADRPVGPTRLDVSQCLDITRLNDVMKLVLSEGCLGETGAALEALEAAELATDSAIKQAFFEIARDEQRHAELAFQFLRWALTESPDSARAELAREAALRLADFECAREHADEQPQAGDSDLSAHGLLSATVIGTVRRQAARSVVAPLLASVLGVHTLN